MSELNTSPKPHNFKNLAGQRFGRLLVISYAGRKRWLCRCDCGAERIVFTCNMRSGCTVSCGCLNKEGINHRTHGMSYTPIYGVWHGMIARCRNPNHKHFDRYGGRGIKVCDRWANSFSDFRADMGPRPDGGSLDRIDNDGNYEPGNCRWATSSQQMRNRRTTINLTFDGKTQCLKDWAKEVGMYPETLRQRIVKGWGVEAALTTPVGPYCRNSLMS